MSRWSRVVRGMIGMGLTFSAGIGAVGTVIAGLVWLLPGAVDVSDMVMLVVGSSIWAFPIGVAFSGVMALTARGRSFDRLSLPRFAALGAGAGLLLFGVLAANAWQAWSLETALVNATIFVVLGSGSATISLVLARRAAPSLESGADPPSLGEGREDSTVQRR